MIQYRKAGLRTFYRVADKNILMIRNMHSRSVIDMSNGNPVIVCDAVDGTTEITEEEFKKEFDIAFSRIKNMSVE